MLIAVTSPIHGQGTTTLACTLAHNISLGDKVRSNDNVLILDLNKNNDVIRNYIDAAITRGWDDYVVGEQTGMFKVDGGEAVDIAESFIMKAVKHATDGLYVTGAPIVETVTEELLQLFMNRANNFFRHVVVDCAPGYDENTRNVLDQADVIIVNLTQDIRNFSVIADDFLPLFKKHDRKIVFTMNRSVSGTGKHTISLNNEKAKTLLSQMRISVRGVTTLPYSAFLLEESNNNRLLRVVDSKELDTVYFSKLSQLTSEVIGRGGSNA